MAFEYQGFATLGVNLNRQKYGPLDISNVFTSAADLKYYLTKGTFTEGVSKYWYESADKKVVPYPYEGQVLATVIDGVVNVYTLALDAEGNFVTQEIAGKIEVDGTTIVKDAEGKLSIVAPVDPDSSKTYNFSYANGVYSWVEVDTATAAGQAQAIAGLQNRATELEKAVNGVEASEGVEAVKGLVEKVADNAQAIADEASARAEAVEALTNAIGAATEGETAASGVYAAIEAAEARAKAYADANDSDTVYDDTALAARVKAIEDDYLVEADKYDDTDLKARVKALEDEERYDETALANRVTAVENAVNNETTGLGAHETRIQAMETFWAATEDSDGIVNKLKEIQDYIASDETGAATMAGDIKKNAEDIAKVDGKIAAAIAPLATTEALNGVKATAEAAATKDYADAELAKKVDKTAYEADKATFAVAETVNATLALKANAADVVANTTFEEFKTANTQVINGVKATAEAAATKVYVDTELAKKANADIVYTKSEIDLKIGTPGTPATGAEGEDGYVAPVNGTGVFANTYSKAELNAMLDKIEGGSTESAASVARQLETYVSTNNNRVTLIEQKDAAQDTAIEAAQTQADKGVADAATAQAAAEAAALAVTNLTNGQVNKNKNDIATLTAIITGTGSETPENSHATRIGVLETYKTTHTGEFNTLKGRVDANETAIATKAEAADVYTKTAADNLLNAKADKADTYTKGEVDAAVQAAIDAIPDVDFTPYAKTADVEATVATINTEIAKKANAADVYTKTDADAKFMTEAQVKSTVDKVVADVTNTDTIEGLVTLVEYVHDNAGEIAKLVNDVATNKAAHEKNASDIEAINSAIDEIVQPKESAEVSVAEDGTLGIKGLNVNKLVQTEGDVLILNGGSATV